MFERLKTMVAGMTKSRGPTFNIPSTWPANWFQTAKDLQGYAGNGNSVVESCVSAYAQTIAQLPFRHVRVAQNGEKTRIFGSNVANMLTRPNPEQTPSFFLQNLVYSLMFRGNGYWVGNSDNPSTFTEMWLLDPRVTRAERAHTGDVFYSTSGPYVEAFGGASDLMIPERAIGHVRLHTPYDPLIGVSPLENATQSVAAHNAITGHQGAFYTNMARPSGVLTTEMKLNKDQMVMLREAWAEQAKDLNSGGVPILSNGLSWSPLTMTSQDAELVGAWKMTVEEISRVYRVPPMLINNLEQASFNNAETLMGFWLASGLGFVVNHVEQELARFFDLPDGEEIEADTQVLLRTNYETQINGINTAVSGGIMAINEGRSKLGLGPVEGGEVPRVQQQYVPVDRVDELMAAQNAPTDDPDGPTIEDETIQLSMDPGEELFMLADQLITRELENAA